MTRDKALGLVRTILATHRDAMHAGANPARAFDDARTDLEGLVHAIYDSCSPTDADVDDGDEIKLSPPTS